MKSSIFAFVITVISAIATLSWFEAPYAVAEDAPDVASMSSGEFADVYLGEMNKIADALGMVKDEASAASAAEIIRSASTLMDDMSEAGSEEMSEQQMLSMVMSRQQEFTQVQSRIGMAMAQLASTRPDLMQTLSKEMSNLPTPGQ